MYCVPYLPKFFDKMSYKTSTNLFLINIILTRFCRLFFIMNVRKLSQSVMFWDASNVKKIVLQSSLYFLLWWKFSHPSQQHLAPLSVNSVVSEEWNPTLGVQWGRLDWKAYQFWILYWDKDSVWQNIDIVIYVVGSTADRRHYAFFFFNSPLHLCAIIQEILIVIFWLMHTRILFSWVSYCL